jgi:LPXTG-motif cell wall-anchored protein
MLRSLLRVTTGLGLIGAGIAVGIVPPTSAQSECDAILAGLPPGEQRIDWSGMSGSINIPSTIPLGTASVNLSGSITVRARQCRIDADGTVTNRALSAADADLTANCWGFIDGGTWYTAPAPVNKTSFNIDLPVPAAKRDVAGSTIEYGYSCTFNFYGEQHPVDLFRTVQVIDPTTTTTSTTLAPTTTAPPTTAASGGVVPSTQLQATTTIPNVTTTTAAAAPATTRAPSTTARPAATPLPDTGAGSSATMTVIAALAVLAGLGVLAGRRSRWYSA